MSNNPVSIVLINYNGEKFIKSCLDSLLNQTHKNLEIIFIDNASQDGSCKLVGEKYPQVTLVANGDNIGYARAANQGIKLARGEFVVPMNPDIICEPNYIERAMWRFNEDEKIGAITGKIYKYDFEKNQKTDCIDTVGLFSYRNRRIIDDGQGLLDSGKPDSPFNRPHEIFGVSGACAIFRKSALEDIKVFEQYYDGDFFMYKEDVDISWRLRLYGWKCFYEPSAVAYHGRGTGVLKRFTHLEVARNRSKLNVFQKYHSYRNQRWMQVKNEFVLSILKDFFPLAFKEVLIFGYMLVREPYLFKSFFEMIAGLPKMLKKRKYIFAHKKATRKEMEAWLRGRKSEYLKQEQLENEP